MRSTAIPGRSRQTASRLEPNRAWGRGERDTMLGSDRRREAKLPEHALEYR
ncbi:MAG: hypothetical protein AB2817_09550 [Candidatus Thiodiazotropha sp.]